MPTSSDDGAESIANLTSYAKRLKAMSDTELLRDLSGWNHRSVWWHLCDAELQRRLNFWNTVRSWLGVAISVISLVIAVAAALRAH